MSCYKVYMPQLWGVNHTKARNLRVTSNLARILPYSIHATQKLGKLFAQNPKILARNNGLFITWPFFISNKLTIWSTFVKKIQLY